MAVIEVEHLTKDYGCGRGVFDVSFGVEKSEVFGFLGPNGAGKTTTIRHIMGFSRPAQGHTRVNGLDSFRNYYKIMKNVGYLPGEVALPAGLDGKEFIEMMMGFRKMKNRGYLDYLLDKFSFKPEGSLKRMSLGDKRKMAIVTAFMHDPDILVLDEPTSGLDPIMQENFIEFVKEEKTRGKTILLSSHIFYEVDETCDRIAIIKDGKIVDTFIADKLKNPDDKEFDLTFANAEGFSAFMKTSYKITSSNDKSYGIKTLVPKSGIAEFMRAIGALGVVKFDEVQFSLQDYFMSFYDRRNGEDDSAQ
jgi:ABC-2 type transport system ATP-binding protein